MAVTFAQYEKAVAQLSAAIAKPKDEFIRDSVIQRFEFCTELAWKVSKKAMGTSTAAPKEVIREMAQSSLIIEVQKWLLAIDMRNLSSHTYNEDIAERVYNFAIDFLPEFVALSTKLRDKS